MWKTDVMVAVAPGASTPRVHGNAVVQAPLFEVNVSPVGVGSFTTTPTAVDGPMLLTTVVNVMSVPAVAQPELAVLLSWMSAAGVLAGVSVAVSSAGGGSVVVWGGVALGLLVA